MKQNIFLPLGLISVIFISGCIQTTTPAVLGNGLVITDFSSSIEDVEGKDRNVRLSLEIENQGGFKANKDGVLVCLMGSNFPGETSQQMWKNETPICQKPTRDLSPADPINNLPGGSARFSWTLKSPWIPYPQERVDEFIGRIYYNYTTRASATVWVYSEDEIRSAKQRGETLPEVLDVVKTTGPVDISLSAVQPVRAEDGYFTLRITVSNIGGGTVFNHTDFNFGSSTPPSLGELNQVELEYSYPNELKSEGCDDIIELKRGETRTISCDFKINKPESITTKKSYPVTVSAEYGYFIDDSISITVRGKKGQTP